MPLEDFANTRTPGRVCWACSLPEQIRNEMDDTRRRLPGVGASAVVRWLIAEHGYEEAQISHAAINNHFQRGHHTR